MPRNSAIARCSFWMRASVCGPFQRLVAALTLRCPSLTLSASLMQIQYASRADQEGLPTSRSLGYPSVFPRCQILPQRKREDTAQGQGARDMAQDRSFKRARGRSSIRDCRRLQAGDAQVKSDSIRYIGFAGCAMNGGTGWPLSHM